MAKRRLTQNQQRRINANRQKALMLKKARNQNHNEASKFSDEIDGLFGEAQEGLVVSRHATHADVENHNGEIIRCNIRRTLDSIVVGDLVVWRAANQQLQGVGGVIEARHHRMSELSRPDYYDGLKPIAANIDRIIIVATALPQLSLNIIDRYLVICELIKIEPIIILNKIDLLSPKEREDAQQMLSIYSHIGYQTLSLSAKTGENIPELIQFLANHTAIFVGQSGVGKSSLVNTILPNVNALTGDISSLSGLGQHTTTASRLYHLPQGGKLIDSPGIREFGLWHLEPDQITRGYREFLPYLGTCKFRDCKHAKDPACSIREAVESGKISTIRYQNYHRLIAARSETKSQRHFSI
ncbi:ribosome biogenesis GTPase RsgA [Mergibacter septicus]|uniref:Small ribosomal subunit biogenesis GTPase RsgA n=1 Tax=Mergibacter septicus TaxID=221402 RepID=A0A8D4J261_9PAST|nr:small ribosomal subunit biogenesis GTPase RsgA [Mergibacter septicus]AWX15465.1 ribosome biogenesis GTPase RsgA [Mergibacter septicus]QDJ14718.1 ribosome biogenesis GTPase RsgA [Mergibacter septicus]UTU47854.1 small ribosomal subunit biogenesis GTPase RsgA [Mergibacter septicus]WMR96540.1 small ribosomal subunit biogenesis GTPase RsgA [Mergibacter septicus]